MYSKGSKTSTKNNIHSCVSENYSFLLHLAKKTKFRSASLPNKFEKHPRLQMRLIVFCNTFKTGLFLLRADTLLCVEHTYNTFQV